jgi:16S rRNA (guanine966-N2)-methyltransferase
MRIVGGVASGRRIIAPAGAKTRPTGERVREALFNSLAPRLADARVLDLYGGSGALSLEALSWGAHSAVVCDPWSAARRVILDNAKRLGMAEQIQWWPMTAETALRRLVAAEAQFDLILCDPPWQEGIEADVRAEMYRICANDATVVVEHPMSEPGPALLGMAVVRSRRYGRTELTFYRLRPNGATEE